MRSWRSSQRPAAARMSGDLGRLAREVRCIGAIPFLAVILGAAAPALAPSPATARTAYVTNYSAKTVAPIDLTTNTPGTPIDLGAEPWGVVITPNDRTAYVSVTEADEVVPINLATNTPGTPIPVGLRPEKLAITPDGSTVYVPNENGDTVTPISVATNTAGTPIPVGKHPSTIAITPDGRTAYVTDEGEGKVSTINLSTNTTGTTIAVGKEPEGIAITPDGRTAYVANYESGDVTPIDVATNTPGTPIPVGTDPEGLAITPNGGTVYVSNFGSQNVTPIDVATNTPGTPIPLTSKPAGIAIAPSGKTAWVGSWVGESVTPINLATNAPGAPLVLGGEPSALAVEPDQGPTAAFSVSPEPAGAATSFDGSASAGPPSGVAAYAWTFGDGSSASGATATVSHVYAAPGTYTATLAVTDNEGCSASLVFTGQTAYCSPVATTTVSHTVTVPTPAPVPPTLSAVHQSASRWREGHALPRISRRRRPPRGTTFSFTLNEQASVRLAFTRAVGGRRLGHRCVTPGTRNRGHARCRRTSTAGVLTFGGHAGVNRVAFEGRLSRARKLRPGRYDLLVTATDSAGQTSAPRKLSFTIVG